MENNMSENVIHEKGIDHEPADEDRERVKSIGLLKTCSNLSTKFSHTIDRLFYR